MTYWILIMSTVGAIVPALGDGDTVLAHVLSTVGIWLFFYLVRRGVRDAAIINRIVTIAKVVPIIVFVILTLFYLDPQVFADNWSSGSDYGTLFDQVRATMLVTVPVFLGVEGANVYSRHANRRADVGRATVLGFLMVFSVFASVTIVSYGILPNSELAEVRQLFVAANDEDMPRFLRRKSAADVPTALAADVDDPWWVRSPPSIRRAGNCSCHSSSSSWQSRSSARSSESPRSLPVGSLSRRIMP
jgi:amino acid transporter